jgi:glycosyltransferase involved in cell wall biosynthesis
MDRGTHRIIVISDYLRRRKAATGSAQKIAVIPPPFNMDAFAAARAHLPCHRPLADVEKPVIGIVGRLSREKGHRYLIAALPAILAEAPKTQLIIVGSGPLEAALREQVRTLSLTKSVAFVGYKRQIYAELARMDILCVPSLSEAFGIVILEGMAMGLPVVGTRVGGIPEVIRDGETGILVPPRDVPALAQACKYLLSHPEEGVQMGLRGKERVLADFHPAQFIADHERLYESAMVTHCPDTRLWQNIDNSRHAARQP